MWILRTALLASLLAFVFAKPIYPWNGNSRVAIYREYQDSDSMESNESSNRSDDMDGDTDGANSFSEADVSNSVESSGSATSESESQESSSSEEDFLTTAGPGITSITTAIPSFTTEGQVTCFTVHQKTEEVRGDNLNIVVP